MATHASILAWEILWTEEPGGVQSMRSQRVRYDLATKLQQEIQRVPWRSVEGEKLRFSRAGGEAGGWRERSSPFLCTSGRCPTQRTCAQVLLPDGPPQAVLPRLHLPMGRWGKEGPASLPASPNIALNSGLQNLGQTQGWGRGGETENPRESWGSGLGEKGRRVRNCLNKKYSCDYFPSCGLTSHLQCFQWLPKEITRDLKEMSSLSYSSGVRSWPQASVGWNQHVILRGELFSGGSQVLCLSALFPAPGGSHLTWRRASFQHSKPAVADPTFLPSQLLNTDPSPTVFSPFQQCLWLYWVHLDNHG